jgi:lipoate-protein ligase A
VTCPTPAENLACDEALLHRAEEDGGPEILRFWESPEHFVALGYANKVRDEVNLTACRTLGVPILRRCSGGGSVLQGPGCLNYSLILRIEGDSSLRSVGEANAFVMEGNRQAIASLLDQPVTVRGVTDLALGEGELKFSGNAQRRRRHWLLFHGTFLIDFDLGLIERLLLQPPREPSYRRNRSHAEFLVQLPVSRDSIKAALRHAWEAQQLERGVPQQIISQLVRDKYATDNWNLRS